MLGITPAVLPGAVLTSAAPTRGGEGTATPYACYLVYRHSCRFQRAAVVMKGRKRRQARAAAPVSPGCSAAATAVLLLVTPAY
jgi:hypothetical protein